LSGNGAYEGEMNDLVLFENALRAAVPTRPDPAIGTALVPRLADVARAATLEAETRRTPSRTRTPRSRLALVARVGIAVALIPLVLAGLAVAGVTVPGPARDAFHAVGIALPNQPAQHSPSSSENRVPAPAHSPSGSTTTSSGTATSKGKSDAAHRHAREQHAKAHGKALGHEKGKAVGLNGSTPPGQAKAKETGPPSHSNAGGNSDAQGPAQTPPGHTTKAPNGNGYANGHSK
jgi:hypothetical protein